MTSGHRTRVAALALTLVCSHVAPPAIAAAWRASTLNTSPAAFLDRAVVRDRLDPAWVHELGARITRRIPALEATEIQGPSYAEIVLRLRARGVSVEPVYRGGIATTDEACIGPGCTPSQWHHALTLAPDNWARPTTGNLVEVAVLDTLIDTTHPDWVRPGGTGPDIGDGGQLVLAKARTFVEAHSGGAAYHGTFVAGLIAAAANGQDTIGVAPRGVAIVPYAVVDGNGQTDSTMLAQATIDAWRSGARVLNLSLGMQGDSPTLHDALRLISTGDTRTPAALIVAAAGNHMRNKPFYPASYPEVLSVSATTPEDRIASCSNYNANVSVSAPGDRLLGLAPMPQRVMQAPCGTSAAAPQVAAVGALLFGQDPSRSANEVRALIERTADDIGAKGRDSTFGHGRLNVSRALFADRTAAVDPGPLLAAGRDSTARIEVTARSTTRTVTAVRATLDDHTITLDAAFDTSIVDASGILDTHGLAAGLHRVRVAARDTNGWGPSTVTYLFIDTIPPVITSVDAPPTLRAASSVIVRYNAIDAAATQVINTVELRHLATGAIIRATSGPTPNGNQAITIPIPDTALPGPYAVSIDVSDPFGNTARATATTLIV